MSMFDPTNMVVFYNDSGSTIDPFSVFRVDGLHAVDGVQMLVAKQSNVYGSQYSHYINGPTSVANHALGGCFGMFPCLAAVNGSPAKGDQVGPRNGQWNLRASTYGFRVVDLIESGLAIVEREPMLAFTGKFDADVSQGSAGTVSIYYPSSGTLTDTTENMSSVLAVSGDFLSTAFVNVTWLNGRWEAYTRECDV